MRVLLWASPRHGVVKYVYEKDENTIGTHDTAGWQQVINH